MKKIGIIFWMLFKIFSLQSQNLPFVASDMNLYGFRYIITTQTSLKNSCVASGYLKITNLSNQIIFFDGGGYMRPYKRNIKDGVNFVPPGKSIIKKIYVDPDQRDYYDIRYGGIDSSEYEWMKYDTLYFPFSRLHDVRKFYTVPQKDIHIRGVGRYSNDSLFRLRCPSMAGYYYNMKAKNAISMDSIQVGGIKEFGYAIDSDFVSGNDINYGKEVNGVFYTLRDRQYKIYGIVEITNQSSELISVTKIELSGDTIAYCRYSEKASQKKKKLKKWGAENEYLLFNNAVYFKYKKFMYSNNADTTVFARNIFIPPGGAAFYPIWLEYFYKQENSNLFYDMLKTFFTVKGKVYLSNGQVKEFELVFNPEDRLVYPKKVIIQK